MKVSYKKLRLIANVLEYKEKLVRSLVILQLPLVYSPLGAMRCTTQNNTNTVAFVVMCTLKGQTLSLQCLYSGVKVQPIAARHERKIILRQPPKDRLSKWMLGHLST